MNLFVLALALSASKAWASPLLRQIKTTTTTSEQPRIVGGTAAAVGQYPFFVSWNGCGASLIYPDIILSAAHCNVITTNQVIVGNTNYGSTSAGGTWKTITRRAIHPNYNASTMVNDFLVMKIDSNATQTPIPMNNNPNYPATGQILTVIGFGSLTNGGTNLPTNLQQVNVNTVSQSSCSSSYPSQIDQTTMLCAGVSGGGKDSCQGDSGGPIFDSNGLLVGTVSWGFQCALSGYPGVYSRTSGGFSWINQQICALSSYPPSWCSGSGVAPTSAPVASTSAPVAPTRAPVVPPTIPVATPTSAPVQQTSTCRDSTTTFLVDSVTGNQGCSWLSINMSRYGYLCKFVDVGRACPVTCSLCGVFASRLH